MGLQLLNLERLGVFLFLARGLGLALLAAVTLHGRSPAGLGEYLLDPVHQVLAIEPRLEALGVDRAFGKQVGAAGHFQPHAGGAAIERSQARLAACWAAVLLG